MNEIFCEIKERSVIDIHDSDNLMVRFIEGNVSNEEIGLVLDMMDANPELMTVLDVAAEAYYATKDSKNKETAIIIADLSSPMVERFSLPTIRPKALPIKPHSCISKDMKECNEDERCQFHSCHIEYSDGVPGEKSTKSEKTAEKVIESPFLVR